MCMGRETRVDWKKSTYAWKNLSTEDDSIRGTTQFGVQFGGPVFCNRHRSKCVYEPTILTFRLGLTKTVHPSKEGGVAAGVAEEVCCLDEGS